LRERFNSVVVNFFKTAMTPTTKLVADMVAMQACYVNTTHPDFLNGHKVRFTHCFLYKISPSKAMALVTDRLNANKPATPEPKAGKVTAAQMNNNKDLEVDFKKEEPSFFGSFFSSSKSQQAKAKKGPQPMEPVFASSYLPSAPWTECFYVKPPTVIRPQAALNERETLETEVISASSVHNLIYQALLIYCRRTAHPLLFQHCEARDDRHGSQSNHTDPRESLEGEPSARTSTGII
jgi:vacuolar protein sorting-associated protein 1